MRPGTIEHTTWDPQERKRRRAGVDAVCRNLDQLVLYGVLYTGEREALLYAVLSIESACGTEILRRGENT